MSAFSLAGKRVLLTGGSQGIGAAAVLALRAAGARVVFSYRTREDLAREVCRQAGDGVAAVRADLADAEAPARLIDDCLQRLGGIDVLVNNAAVYVENSLDAEDFARWRARWRTTFAINLFAAADLAWLAIAAMRAARSPGTIVNIASRAAHRGEPEFADYAASKAALINLTKSIARGCAADGITAFAIAPGFIASELAAPMLAAHGDRIAAEIPSGRVGTPADVGAIVAFLASPAAAYATGSTIDVNGASYVR